MTPRHISIKTEIARIHQVALRRHRSGENARRVVQGISDGVDALLRAVFSEELATTGKNMAMVAVGGYGRRELCPFSDVDLLFLCDDLEKCGEAVERIVRNLWDSGLQLGQAVRTPADCLKFMKDDDITAATLIESRFLAGSEGLMRQFQEKALNRYHKIHRESFAGAKLQTLRRSLEGEGRTIYVTEPNLKEGMCCLRDVQHILWIERIRRDVLDFQDIALHGGFSFEEVRKLEEAYTFLLRVRCELHFLNNLRQDILELDSQVEVARNLGYLDGEDGRGIEKLMSDFYRHARNVLRFGRYYVETKSRGTRFLSKLSHRLFPSRVSANLALLDGHLYLNGKIPEEPDSMGKSILDMLIVAQECDADFGQTLCELIRRQLAENPSDLSRSEAINGRFLRILSRGRSTGRTLSLMHEIGVLGRIIPEFQRLTCLVNFDGHHQFTVDEHTLQTLRELDRIESDPNYPEPEFRRVLDRIPDRLPLRIALLLHDIGKSIPGAHDTQGTEAAVVICERLGLGDAATATVEFLIYRHLALSRFSDRMDLTDERAISSLARMVANRRNLDMLYLLTYIDIHSVGAGTWTAWKGAQLSELYNKTCIHLETGGLPAENLPEVLAASGIDPRFHAAIHEHCRLIDNPSYQKETIPERMLAQIHLVEEFLKEGSIQVLHDRMIGCSLITFCAKDRPHLFADLAGLLVSEGLNIVGARIYSRSDGVALDLFQVVIADNLRLDMEHRVGSLRQKLAKIEKGYARITDLISDRARRYRFRQARKPLFPPRVEIDNELSETCTVLEVNAGDRPGLLYDLATAIADLGLDLRTAKVSTMIDRAHDVFYVAESGGGKVQDPARRKEITDALARAAEWHDLREVRTGEPIAPRSQEG